MPWINVVRDVVKEHREVQISLEGILADFIQSSFVGAYVPIVYEEEIRVSLNLVDKKLRLAGCIPPERDTEKKTSFLLLLIDSS
jgi:hypothetical protein